MAQSPSLDTIAHCRFASLLPAPSESAYLATSTMPSPSFTILWASSKRSRTFVRPGVSSARNAASSSWVGSPVSGRTLDEQCGLISFRSNDRSCFSIRPIRGINRCSHSIPFSTVGTVGRRMAERPSKIVLQASHPVLDRSWQVQDVMFWRLQESTSGSAICSSGTRCELWHFATHHSFKPAFIWLAFNQCRSEFTSFSINRTKRRSNSPFTSASAPDSRNNELKIGRICFSTSTLHRPEQGRRSPINVDRKAKQRDRVSVKGQRNFTTSGWAREGCEGVGFVPFILIQSRLSCIAES